MTNDDIRRIYTGETGFILDDDPAALLDFGKAMYNKAICDAARVAWNHEPEEDGPIETGIRAMEMK
jgi:Ser/Thr protein kinase RdoA (MazF antagonist)